MTFLPRRILIGDYSLQAFFSLILFLVSAWFEYSFSVFINFSRGFSRKSITKCASKNMRKAVFYFFFFSKKYLVSFWKNIVLGTDRPFHLYLLSLTFRTEIHQLLDVDHEAVNQWGASIHIGDISNKHDRIPQLNKFRTFSENTKVRLGRNRVKGSKVTIILGRWAPTKHYF